MLPSRRCRCTGNQLTIPLKRRGTAHKLAAHEANRISITPDSPGYQHRRCQHPSWLARSGVIARFPVERVRSGTFRLVTDDGKPVPVGAVVTLKGAQFPVVLDGMVYVTGFDHGLAAEASWTGGHCRFRLEPPPPDDPLPDMGTVPCHDLRTARNP